MPWEKERIAHELLNLPGEQAHSRMAVTNRPVSKESWSLNESTRDASVAIIFINAEESEKLVFIQRPVYQGAHSGQISFPGGKYESGENGLDCAIRETYEEIGFLLDPRNHVGELSELYIPPSNFLVYPQLFYIEETPPFIPDSREVEEVFTLEIKDLFNAKSKTDIQLSSQLKLKNVPCYQHGNRMIWGATALMISELEAIFSRIEKGS